LFHLEKREVLLDKLFYTQIITGVIQLLYYRHAVDDLKGTFFNAHYLGVFLVLYLFLIIKKEKKKFKDYIGILLSVLALWLCDAKHVWALFLLSLGICWILKKIGMKKNYDMICCIGLFSIIAIIVMIFNSDIIYKLEDNQYIRVYVLNSQYNKKANVLINTFQNLKSINGIFGFGCGLYGSQIAISMGKGVIYPWDQTLAGFHYISEPYRRAIAGLMTKNYVLYGIAESSMVLGYPLVSYIALVGELGIIGFFCFFKLINKYMQESDRTLIVFFMLISIFDTYFEIQSVFLFIIIITAMMTEGAIVNGNEKKGKVD
jgi:hypothetical protein